MKITIESTTRIVNASGIECRVWEGVTERGIKVQCLIPRIAALKDEDLTPADGFMKHNYEPDDLRAMFQFCRKDFEQFLDLLAWMETLPHQAADEQISAAKRVRELRAPRGSVQPESRPGFPPGEARGAEGLTEKEIG